MASSALPIIDHIVILVSHTTLLALPDILGNTFTVVIGGSHADGLTHNNLILFQDGSYIEVIAFFDGIDPERRAAHRWGSRPENTVIDWAYTLPQGADFKAVQERVAAAQAVYVYEDPVDGGRTRPDGAVLKWAVAAARDRRRDARVDAGKLPFWCLDHTPRDLRVPYEGNPQTDHPSGARGVSRISVRVPAEEVLGLSKVYDGIHDSLDREGHSWRFGTHAGIEAGEGQHDVELGRTAGEGGIEVVLLGDGESPDSVEILPGLVLKFEV